MTSHVFSLRKLKFNYSFVEKKDMNNNNDRLTAFDPGQPG